jgi:small-conductance mechanosensitive channel
MATKSQCVFRQLRSRRVTSKRFLSFKEIDKQRTAEKRRALVEKSRAMVAGFTQRLCKRKRIQKATENRRQKELEALREINKLQNTYITERAIQQKELEQYYEKKRIVWQRHYDEEKRYDKLKVDIERVNRKIDYVTEADRRNNDILKMQVEIQKEIRTKVHQLEEEVVAKCQKYREFCLRCLENPTDQDEIKTGRELKRLIRMR